MKKINRKLNKILKKIEKKNETLNGKNVLLFVKLVKNIWGDKHFKEYIKEVEQNTWHITSKMV